MDAVAAAVARDNPDQNKAIGCAAGVLVAYGLIRAALPLVAHNIPIPRIQEASIDGGVLAFSIGLAALTTLLFSLAPVARTARPELAGSDRITRNTLRARSG